MKIQLLSDLHHEFSMHGYRETDADVLVLAGDIDTGTEGIRWAKTLGKPVVYVSGNHEFYRREMLTSIEAMREAAQGSNVHFLEKDAVVIQGTRFLGTTLWTDFQLFGPQLKKKALRIGQQGLNDFRMISYGNTLFTAEDAMTLHADSVHWLAEQLDTPHDGPTVVVSHHMPVAQVIAPQYASDLLSCCFASRLDHLMGKAALWCFGHTHESADVNVNGTRVVGNPRGYSRYRDSQENNRFDAALVLEV